MTKKTAANAALEKKLVEMELQIKESKQARELANKQLIEEGLKKKIYTNNNTEFGFPGNTVTYNELAKNNNYEMGESNF